MRKILLSVATTTSLFFSLSANAMPTPQLFPNDHLNNVSAAQANRDIQECQTRGQRFEQQNRESFARQGTRNAARGAALGALGGSIAGNAGRGAGAGAAIGGAATVMDRGRDRREGSDEFRQFVSACLEIKGYRVIGWN